LSKYAQHDSIHKLPIYEAKMSLQLAAQHLSSHGRGQDSTLVHMSPREVSSLNALAKAHGGHLTTNPHTGLPEAGFLEMILPIAIGALAGPGGMALGAETALGSAGTAALIGGGLTYAMTGSLSKGLMAGLGAYGGAGLGEGLAKSGMDAAISGDTAAQAAQKDMIANANSKEFFNPTHTDLNPGMADKYAAAQNAASTNYADAVAKLKPTGLMDSLGMMGKGIGSLGESGGISNLYQNLGGSPMSLLKTVGSAAAPAISSAITPKQQNQTTADANMGQRYGFAMNPTSGQPQQAQTGQNPPGTPQTTTPFPTPDIYGREQRYFAPSYTKLTPDQAKSMYGYADGGAVDEDRPTETPALQMFKQMQAQRAAQPQAPQIDANAQFNQYAQQSLGAPNKMQAPAAIDPTTVPTPNGYGYMYNPVAQKYTQVQGTPSTTSDSTGADFSIDNRPVVGYTSTGEKIYGEQSNGIFGGLKNTMSGRAAGGSISDAGYNLGGYSDGGRLLRGPGDGVSDSIPAVIGKKQPARLADGEFVVPARIVSELGNGSTEAGARKLYAMMDRIQSARGKTVGKGKVAKNSRSEKYLPA